RRAEAALPAAARKWRVARGVRAHRAGLRLRQRRDANDRATRGRRVPARRRQAVHHERRRRPRLRRLREDRPRRRSRGHLGLRRRGGRTGLRGRPDRAEDGDQGFDDRGDLLQRLPCAGGEPARLRGRGLQDRDAHPRPLPAGNRRAGARARAGGDRLRARIRALPRDDGQADRRAPAGRRNARRHGDEVRSGARPPLQGRAHDRRGRNRAGAHEAFGDGEAVLQRRRHGRDDRRGADPRRLRLHHRVSRRAHDARCEDHTDLRRHEPDPAARDRTRDAQGEPRLPARRRRVIEPARSFDLAAEEYERTRPDYPDAVLELVPVGAEATVLDLGAGTGKLTRVLARHYARVIAVEPLDGMRAILERVVPEAEALSGRAEQIPLPDSAVDGVFAGQAFHWFANDEAVAEIARVLRPGGALGVVWNAPDESRATPLPQAFVDYLDQLRAAASTFGDPSFATLVGRAP